MKKRKNALYTPLLCLFVTLFLMPQALLPARAVQDQLKYEVNVRALIIPVFAVDKKGEPVFDLKAEDIQLLVNRKPFKFSQLTPFPIALEEEEEVTGKTETTAKPLITSKTLGRINFIILDSVANSDKGVYQARKIAIGIVEKSPGNDAFVVIETNPVSGMRYIIGPSHDKKELTAAISKIKMFGGSSYAKRMLKPDGSRFRRSTMSEPVNRGDSNDYADRLEEYRRHMFNTNLEVHKAGQRKYMDAIRRFAYSLGQLKYALKTITRPKTVFLISGGVPAGRLKYNPIGYYDFLGKSAKAINQGGSLLYMINSVPPLRVGAGETLKYMADESGGKYFAGGNVNKVVTRVNKHTSAYYELVFYPGKNLKDNFRIKLKSKRKGVKLATVNHAERGKPYQRMELLQKKLFALSVITGGSWSRIVGKVRKTKIKKTKRPANLNADKKETQKRKSKFVSVSIPKYLLNRDVDIFVVNLDPITMKAGINVSRQKITGNITLQVPVDKNKTQHVVIVEPEKTLCVYNQVK